MRINHGSDGPFEEIYGYSRAVRVGQHVAVAGTCARDDALVGDAYAQAADALGIIERALAEVGAELADVVRTVAYVTDIRDMEKVAAAHRAVFADVRPAATLVEVSRLADPRYLVEIQADAIVTDAADSA
ncbi:RidA family protein [Demequina muriae]|uniref:RidA family protein n=1 Tax=Demequina muriae TaxID=3051664 RepID=A0ABT8GH90_9MICO|nr:RidA family protein [Demequina sp. EGI L300058]MDN4480316.1 RidA family protein [Demequina sp. EGI L300058]